MKLAPALDAVDTVERTGVSGHAVAPRPGRALLVAALGTVYLVWGSSYLAIEVAIVSLPPMLMASVRFLVAGAVLYAWAIRRGDTAGDRPTRSHWRNAAYLAALMLIGSNGTVSLVADRMDSGTTALLVASVPLWMGVLGRLRYREPVSRNMVAGMLVGLAGVGVLLDPAGGSGVELWPCLLVVVGAGSWAYGSLEARRLPMPRRPMVGAAMQMLAAGVMFAIIGVARGEAVSLAGVTPSSVLALGYLTVFGSLAAFSAYVWLLQWVRSQVASTYAYVNPIVAVVLGWLVLGEPLTGRTLVAGGLIVGAVVLMVAERRGRGTLAAPASGAPAVPLARLRRRLLTLKRA